MEHLKKLIREVSFKDVNFYDITPLLADRFHFRNSVSKLLDFCPNQTELIVCPEARGFIYGSAIANELAAGLLPVRKKGALPVVGGSITYMLEYGADTIEIPHVDLTEVDNIVLVDDVLATGGSAKAVTDLLKKIGKSIMKYVFLIELTDLKGRNRLDAPVESLLQY